MNDIHISELEITLSDIIKAVCQRPDVYTLHGSFGEVLAFLDGYASGAQLGSPSRSASYFWGFAEWLEARVGIEGGSDGSRDFWRSFRSAQQDEQTAIKRFGEFWQIYRTEHPASTHKEL